MGNRQTNLNYNWVKEHVSLLVREALTERQKKVFEEADLASAKLTASSFVRLMVKRNNFSETSVWHILAKLKRMGLVEFGIRSERKFLSLTELGKFVGGEKDG